MSDREVRVSPDGNAVAIRTDWPADGNKAFGVMHIEHGGAWVPESSIADWPVVSTA